MGKSGGSGSELKDYFGTIAGAICEGPVDYLFSIIIDGHEVWPTTNGVWKSGTQYTAGKIISHDGRNWVCQLTHTATSATIPAQTPTHWLVYSLERGAENYVDITLTARRNSKFRLYWGTDDQAVDPSLAPDGNKKGHSHPAYRGICYAVLRKFYFGREKTSAPNVEVVVGRKADQSLVTGDPAELNDGQANAVAVLGELLTSTNGLGLGPSNLSGSTAQTAADTLEARAAMTGISLLLDQQTTLRDLIEQIAGVTDLWVRWNASSQQMEFGVYTHGTTPASSTTLDVHAYIEPPVIRAGGWRDAMSRAVIRFVDRTRAYKETSDKVDDLRTYTVLGEHRTLNLDRSMVTRRDQALRLAAETLKTMGRPTMSCETILRREIARGILPGSYVLLDIDLEPGGASLLQYFRVIGRNIPRRGSITLNLEAETSLAPIPYAISPSVEVADVEEVPAIEHARICEVPPALAALGFSVMVLAERPDPLVSGLNIHFDTDPAGDFVTIGSASVFATRARLRAAAGASDSSLAVILPAQVDDDRLASDPGPIAAADDTLLAILIEVNPATATAILTDDGNALQDDDTSAALLTDEPPSQIKEDSAGFTWFEVCSISSATVQSALLTDDGNALQDDDNSAAVLSDEPIYSLEVLRGRQGTIGRGFSVENCEVWIIPRSALFTYSHLDLQELRQNRAADVTPDTGFFRLTAFNFITERPLADAVDIPFRLPTSLQSGPVLTITAPAVPRFSVAGPYDYDVPVAATATDANSNLIGWRVSLRKSTEDTETAVDFDTFTPTGSATISATVKISAPGEWFIYVRAFDNFGLAAESVFNVTAEEDSKKVARPEFFIGGKLIPNGSVMFVGSGLFNLRCATAGAEIRWRHTTGGTWNTYDPDDPTTWPYIANVFGDILLQAQARITTGGWTDSTIANLN